MDASELARYLEGVSRDLVGAIGDAEARSLVDLKQEAVRHSQGPLQPADLIRMGHPYSRRRGVKLNPDIVNKVTGKFIRSWETEGPELHGDEMTGRLFNTDPKAHDLEAGIVKGCPLMVPRRPNEAAAALVEPRREQRLRDAIDKVFEG